MTNWRVGSTSLDERPERPHQPRKTVDFIVSIVLFVATGLPTPALLDSAAPHLSAVAPATPPEVVQPVQVPPDAPPPAGTCGRHPHQPCAGAIGFCPQWQCIDGRWVDVRPSPGKGDPLFD